MLMCACLLDLLKMHFAAILVAYSIASKAYWLRCWIPNQDAGPCSKPLDGSKIDSAFHISEVGEMSTCNFWELSGKNKLPPRSGSSFEAIEPHP